MLYRNLPLSLWQFRPTWLTIPAMDVRTLVFTIALVSTALAASTMVLALYRKDRGFSIYAAGFISAVISFLLFSSQGLLPRFLSYIAANVFLLFFQLSLPWGLRSRSGLKPSWPRRFWLYMMAWLGTLLIFTLAFDSFTVRAAASSVFLMAGAAEFLLAFYQGQQESSKVIRYSVKSVVFVFILLHVIRFASIIAYPQRTTNVLDDVLFNVFTFSFTLFFAILWAGLVLVLDAADLLSRLERQNQVFKDMATIDELTGLNNRHSLETKLSAEMERASRYHEPLSIILFDIDHFKHVNDTWGHQVGDEVLKHVARITRDLVREPDDIFRWGGEEFLLVAPHTSLAGAITLAQKLRASFASTVFPEVGAVTASFGVAQSLPGENRDDWFKRADRALYRAKNTGRDRVVGFENDEALPLAGVDIEWRAEWESGNSLIDEEHRQLVDLSNNLLDVSLSNKTTQQMLEAVDTLIAHVAKHFSDEEAVLKTLGYPGLEAHALLHKELVAAALSLRMAVEAGTHNSGVLFNFLVDKVVIGHMIHADAQFFSYTRA